jgi:hypothetical protein
MQTLLASSGALAVEFLPHHLADVAGVSVKDFAEAIIPYFEWLYVPGQGVTRKPEIANKLEALFVAGQGLDLIYFFKTVPERLLPDAPLALAGGGEVHHCGDPSEPQALAPSVAGETASERVSEPDGALVRLLRRFRRDQTG